MIAERLATRTLELVDIASESHSEAALYGYVRDALADADVRELGDGCLLAQPLGARPAVLLAGHTDTVPAQGNRPGSRDAERVAGLGASGHEGRPGGRDRAGAGRAAVRGPVLPARGAAVRRHRADAAAGPRAVRARLRGGVRDGAHGLCRPRRLPGEHQRELAVRRGGGALGAALARAKRDRAGRRGRDRAGGAPGAAGAVRRAGVRRGGVGHQDRGRRGRQRHPGSRGLLAELPLLARTVPESAEARLAEMTAGHGTVEILGHAPSGAVAVSHPLVQQLIAVGQLEVAPKQAWTPVAELAAAGLPAVNFGPGAPAAAHKRDESILIANLVRCYEVLEAFAG